MVREELGQGGGLDGLADPPGATASSRSALEAADVLPAASARLTARVSRIKVAHAEVEALTAMGCSRWAALPTSTVPLGQGIIGHRQHQGIEVTHAGGARNARDASQGPLQTGEKGGVIQPHQRLRLVPRDAPDQEDSPSCMGSRASGPVGETLEGPPGGILGRLDGGDDGTLAIVVATGPASLKCWRTKE